ncbi:hypothetical protein F5B20DRAFT_369354 [Whalleya microplaca]|nr:hypothetical protein F5B20DRAFT_369354 [Whalleya microplaca]
MWCLILLMLWHSTRGVNAGWTRWSGERKPAWMPQETDYASSEGEAQGWTPKPTPAPGAMSEAEQVLEALQRRSTKTVWTNGKTCGWISGSSSYPYTCGNNETCSTNVDNIVACASGTYSPFYSVCLDYSAYQAGACSGTGSGTGCCQETGHPACGTYIWTGYPTRSMYRCFPTASVVSVFDEPQFVVDASLSSSLQAHSHSQTETGAGGSSTSDVVTQAPGSDNTDGYDDVTWRNYGRTGAIVGGVIGGAVAIALTVSVVALLRRRKAKSKRKSKHGIKSLRSSSNNTTQGTDGGRRPPPPPPPPAPAHQPRISSRRSSNHNYHHRNSRGGETTTTFPPQSPYGQGVYTYQRPPSYERSAPEYLSLDTTSSHNPSQPNAPAANGGSVGHQHRNYADTGGVVSELDSTTQQQPAGHQSNPVEMPANNPRW